MRQRLRILVKLETGRGIDMREIKKISIKNLPTKLPVISTWLSLLTMHYFDAPGWLWGSVCVIFVILWGVVIEMMIKEKHTDIFKDKE